MTREEFAHSFRRGVARGEWRRANGGQHRWGWDPDPQKERLFQGMSLVAEVLVAEATGRAWLSSGNEPDKRGVGDVERICVRWTDKRHGSLIIHPDDDDRLYGALVIGARFEELRVAGWRAVLACKEPQWWRTQYRWPAFFVPQRVLFHIDGLSVIPIDLAALGERVFGGASRGQ